MPTTPPGPLPTIYLDHAATSWPKPPEVVAAVTRGAHRLRRQPRARRLPHGDGDLAAHPRGPARRRGVPRRARHARPAVLAGVHRGHEPGAARAAVARATASSSPRWSTTPSRVRSSTSRSAASTSCSSTPTPPAPSSPTRSRRGRAGAHARGRVPAREQPHRRDPAGRRPRRHRARRRRAHARRRRAGRRSPAGATSASLGADAWACSGHKGLLGPQGVGVLYLAPDCDADAARDRRHRRRLEHGRDAPRGSPRPLRGRHAQHARHRRSRRSRSLPRRARRRDPRRGAPPGPPPARGRPRARRASRCSVPSPTRRACRSSRSCTDCIDADRLAFALDRRYGIAVRAGLHCAPWAHRTVGTLETGALRFGIGYGNTDEDIDAALAALADARSGESRDARAPERSPFSASSPRTTRSTPRRSWRPRHRRRADPGAQGHRCALRHRAANRARRRGSRDGLPRGGGNRGRRTSSNRGCLAALMASRSDARRAVAVLRSLTPPRTVPSMSCNCCYKPDGRRRTRPAFACGSS